MSKCGNVIRATLIAERSAGLTGASWFAVEKDPELLAEDSMLAGSQLRTSEVGYFAI